MTLPIDRYGKNAPSSVSLELPTKEWEEWKEAHTRALSLLNKLEEML